MATITGTSASEFLEGTAGDDTFIWSGGDDTLAGGAGFDTLVIEEAEITSARVVLRDFSNVARTGAFLTNSDGETRIQFSDFEGVDITADGVLVEGNDAANYIRIVGSNSRIIAGTGDNTLVSVGMGNSTLSAGSGDNRYIPSPGDIITGGRSGTDTVVLPFASTDPFEITDGREIVLSLDGDTFIHQTNEFGGNFYNSEKFFYEFQDAGGPVTISQAHLLENAGVTTRQFGTEAGEVIVTEDDVRGVYAKAGNDWITANERPFTLDAEVQYHGGSGSDMVSFITHSENIAVYFGGEFAAGRTAWVTNSDRSTNGSSRLYDIERLTGTSFDDSFLGGDNFAFRGMDGDDYFRSRHFEARLEEADAGNNRYDGGPGNDEVDYINSPTAVTASLLRGKGWSGDAAGDEYIKIETLSGSRYNDFLTGGNRVDRLNGSLGNDTLMGNGGDDFIDGSFGTDTAQFGFYRDQYEITQNGFQTIVEYIGRGTGDGTDTLNYIEILRFADGDLVL